MLEVEVGGLTEQIRVQHRALAVLVVAVMLERQLTEGLAMWVLQA